MAGLVEPPLLGLDGVALREWLRVSDAVVTDGVGHVALAEGAHGAALVGGEVGEAGGGELGVGNGASGGDGLLKGFDAATEEGEVRELGDEGGVLVVDLVAAAGGGPAGGVPDGGVQRHGFRRVVTAHRGGPPHLADWDVIDVETSNKSI